MTETYLEQLKPERFPSPGFVVDEAKLRSNVAILDEVQRRTGAKILMALKCFAMWDVFPIISRSGEGALYGCCASSPDEARLARECFGGEVHAFAAGYSEADMVELLETVDHVQMCIRDRLITKGSGHWAGSCGERSAFGLTTAQVVDIVDTLKQHDMLDCLQLLHYHLGSQVPNIRDIRTAVMESTRVYAGLVQEGAKMGYLDLGGGLAVDYDGSHTNYVSSRNYSMDEYCTDVVEAVMTILDQQGIEHPHIVTESGRATVAYYSILLFNICLLYTSTGKGRRRPPPSLP